MESNKLRPSTMQKLLFRTHKELLLHVAKNLRLNSLTYFAEVDKTEVAR